MEFNGFIIYNVFKCFMGNTIVVSHVIKGNTLIDYEKAIDLVYNDWAKKNDNIEDIIVTTYPNSTENVIFHAKDIGTEHEFDRYEFEEKYYKKDGV